MTTSTLRLALVSGLGLATVLVAPRSTLADYNDNNFGPENGWILTVETIPLEIGYVNGCVDGQEQVDISATATLTTKTLTTSGNFTYIKQKQVISGYGIGETTGATYLFSDLQTIRTHSANGHFWSFRRPTVAAVRLTCAALIPLHHGEVFLPRPESRRERHH